MFPLSLLGSTTLLCPPAFSSALAVSMIRFLMSVARLKKAFSTLILDFADTSMNGIPSSSASCCPRSVDTTRFSSQSHLFPINILLTPSVACCSTLENQVRMSVFVYVSCGVLRNSQRTGKGRKGRGITIE